jgi:hypothetical protein
VVRHLSSYTSSNEKALKLFYSANAQALLAAQNHLLPAGIAWATFIGEGVSKDIITFTALENVTSSAQAQTQESV